MDPFTSLIRTLLEDGSYWVRRAPKIELTKKDKKRFFLPPTHRPDIHLLAYDPVFKFVLAIQVAPGLDTGRGAGVTLKEFSKRTETPSGDFPMLTCEPYKKLVLKVLERQLIAKDEVIEDVRLAFGLVVGNVKEDELAEVYKYFDDRDRMFWSQAEISDRVKALADGDDEGSAAALVARILLRETSQASTADGTDRVWSDDGPIVLAPGEEAPSGFPFAT